MRATFVGLAFSVSLAAAADKVDFEKQVYPMLAQRCFSCHGPDVQQSGLRLDKRQNAMRGGDYGPVIIPGKSAESKLIRRVVNGDGGIQMPPTGALSTAEIDLLRAWIDQGADFRMEIHEEAPPKPIDEKVTALISAVRMGSAGDVEKLLRANPGIVNSTDRAGNTPLHHAAVFGSLDTIKLLIDNGGDVNAKNKRRSTPLHWAIPNEAKVRLLLDRGAEVNPQQIDGRTPLYNAASAASADEIVKLLLARGADPNLATSNGQTPLMTAAGHGDVEEAMRMLIAARADVHAKNGAGATALMAAATSRSASAVKILLDRGADANAVTKKDESALQNAATAGVEESVRLLLEHGAKVNVSDDRGYSALMYAASSEAMPAGIVKLLLAKGADVNAMGEGETARTLAAKRGDTEVARILGVSAEERKQGGVAPLTVPSPARSIPEAVQMALGRLAEQSHNFIRIAGCNSCHSQDLPSSAVGIARARGIAVPNEIPQLTEEMNGETQERLMDLIAGSIGGMGWEMFDRSMNHAPADAYSDATIHYLKAMQSPEGYWKAPDGRRPPMGAGDLQNTALAIYALKTYGPAADRAETDAALKRAAAWLVKTQPSTTQERAFHLLGLAWVNAAPAAIESAAHALAASQRDDGGWNQLPGMGSDAYACGQALYALNVAGKMPTSDMVYRKGVRYLLRSQAADGTWHVMTRSIWTQPYFDAGFPYGQEQFISAAGTAWASIALSLAAEDAKVSRRD